jgi:hypothetical protein
VVTERLGVDHPLARQSNGTTARSAPCRPRACAARGRVRSRRSTTPPASSLCPCCGTKWPSWVPADRDPGRLWKPGAGRGQPVILTAPRDEAPGPQRCRVHEAVGHTPGRRYSAGTAHWTVDIGRPVAGVTEGVVSRRGRGLPGSGARSCFWSGWVGAHTRTALG